MSTTTQILFNSPALHSLKRDQLVKLCKTHSIKASGKNIELIERLKKHADTLPKDSPLSIAVREEDAMDEFIKLRNRLEEMNEAGDEDASTRESTSVQMPRPSEQWEVVMESIEEMMEESSSKGTLTSLKTAGSMGSSGEFGTAMSKCKSSPLYWSATNLYSIPHSLQYHVLYQDPRFILRFEAGKLFKYHPRLVFIL